MYKIFLKPIFFLFDPEKIHHITFSLIRFTHSIPGFPALFRMLYKVDDKRLERKVFGLTFPNPVGLAAGMDKDARLVDEFGNMGFGFVEIGTLTPKAQPGNEKPRLFRLIEDEGIINRMGFNNQGVDDAVKRLKKRKSKVIVGGNIGKNKVTPNEEAVKDYEKAFDALYEYVDYFVVNVSSPNTPNLRALQEKEPLKELLHAVKSRNAIKRFPKPILLKIAPDLTEGQLDDIIEIVQETKIDGIIATNTTIDRSALKTDKQTVEKIGMGGLSGKPLRDRSTAVIRYLSEKSGKSIPIIGVGGIHSAEDALEKLEAGAVLLQLYTGFIYEGPSLIKEINKAVINAGK
ncbi:MAG TPA: quinone-dependent dihydroorotate dehydrogenase [Cytophagaceae bacterium]|nr:quinone-dependent dihydroorotate dehydrogenase [Cytophagaceae bacterium]